MMETVQKLFKCVEEKDSPDVIEFLLTDGKVNINECWKDDYSLLMVAARRGRVGTVKLLLKLGANVNVSNQTGKTALIEAARKGQSEVVELLLASGADRKMRDKDKWDAYTFAAAMGHQSTSELLDDYYIKKAKEQKAVKAEESVEHSVPPNSTLTTTGSVPEHSTPPAQTLAEKVLQGLAIIPSAPTNATTSTAGHTWLHPFLADLGFAPELVALCEQKLVQDEAILSLQRFADLTTTEFSGAYLKEIGVKPLGVRHALLQLHKVAVDSARALRPVPKVDLGPCPVETARLQRLREKEISDHALGMGVTCTVMGIIILGAFSLILHALLNKKS